MLNAPGPKLTHRFFFSPINVLYRIKSKEKWLSHILVSLSKLATKVFYPNYPKVPMIMELTLQIILLLLYTERGSLSIILSTMYWMPGLLKLHSYKKLRRFCVHSSEEIFQGSVPNPSTDCFVSEKIKVLPFQEVKNPYLCYSSSLRTIKEPFC